MVTDQAFSKFALGLPECEQKSHFGKVDFRLNNKIFAGFNERGFAYVKLTQEQQEIVCASETPVLRPIPGGWGKQGWTEIDHSRADDALLTSLLRMAWLNVASKTLVKSHQRKE